MKQSPAKLRSNLIEVSMITIGWIIMAILISTYDHATVLSLPETPSLSYSFIGPLFGNLLGALLGGIIGGSSIVFFLKERIQRKPFWFIVAANTLTYLVIIFLITIFVRYTFSSIDLASPFWDSGVSVQVSQNLFKPAVLRTLMIWFLVALGTSFLQEVSEKYGQGVLWQFILGRYHKPKEEVKIFMFLDMKSSTAIAEKLGYHRFFLMLTDFFNDITNPIINNDGQIYQYVGDEIVVTWNLDAGIKNTSCLNCFFDMEDAICRSADRYIQKYGVVPEFKAGIHFGEVTAGEIGVIKKDIVYTGEVINTTSQIQSTCNNYGEKLLISKDLLDLLAINKSYKKKALGAIQLKGKQSGITLFSINRC